VRAHDRKRARSAGGDAALGRLSVAQINKGQAVLEKVPAPLRSPRCTFLLGSSCTSLNFLERSFRRRT
jgi:hypothetical protein